MSEDFVAAIPACWICSACVFGQCDGCTVEVECPRDGEIHLCACCGATATPLLS